MTIIDSKAKNGSSEVKVINISMLADKNNRGNH